MILLPDDDLTGYHIFTTKEHETESANKHPHEEKNDGDEYSTSDFDDDETISTEYANSVNDDTVLTKMKENGHEFLCGRRIDTISQQSTHSPEKASESEEWNDIKLPAVNVRNFTSGTGSSVSKSTHRSKLNSNCGLINSPYAVQRKKPKTIRKAKIKNKRKEPKEDFQF